MQLQIIIYTCVIFSILSTISCLLFKYTGTMKPVFIVVSLFNFCLIFGYISSLLLMFIGNPEIGELGKIGMTLFGSSMYCSLIGRFLENWILKQKK